MQGGEDECSVVSSTLRFAEWEIPYKKLPNGIFEVRSKKIRVSVPPINPNYSLRLLGDLRGAGDRSAKVVGGTSEMGPSAPVGPKGLVEGPTPVFQQMAMCRRGLVPKNQTSWPSIHLSGVGGHVKLIRIDSDVASPSPFNVIISYRSSVNVIQLYPVGRCDFKTKPRQTISIF